MAAAVANPAPPIHPAVRSIRRLRRGATTEEWHALCLEPSTSSSKSGSSSAGSLSSANGQQYQDPIALLDNIDSPFQVQEYLSALIAQDPHDVEKIVWWPRRPRSVRSEDKGKERAAEDSENDQQPEVNGDISSPEGSEDAYIDRDVWLYEHLRHLAMDLTHPLVTELQDVCTRETCPEMKAGEWLYLCAAHATANETECCAIDYITHTLDGATALLNTSRYFPSRLSVPQTSLKHFASIARRLYRIFAHAWFHHRETFASCEGETSLYERFLLLSKEYDLVPADLLVIPSSKAVDPDSRDAEVTGAEAQHGLLQHPRGERHGSVERQGPAAAPDVATGGRASDV